MITILLSIVGCYVLAALAIHAAGRFRTRSASETHYVLMAGNQASRIEWYIRALRLRSRQSGKQLRITVVDCASTDETIAIAERFGRTGDVAVYRLGGRLPAAEGAAMREGTGTRTEGGPLDPSRVLALLHQEGYVPSMERAVLVDLREPEQLRKLLL